MDADEYVAEYQIRQRQAEAQALGKRNALLDSHGRAGRAPAWGMGVTSLGRWVLRRARHAASNLHWAPFWPTSSKDRSRGDGNARTDSDY